MNTEFAWDRNSLSQADKITSIPCSINKDTVRESISKIKNGKTAELSGVVSEMVKQEKQELRRRSKSDYSRQKELRQQR